MPHPLPPGRAICYSGYRDGQSPDTQVYPSEAEILEDLRLLQPHFALLRLYDCTPHAERVLAVIEREALPFRVLLGAWLAARALLRAHREKAVEETGHDGWAINDALSVGLALPPAALAPIPLLLWQSPHVTSRCLPVRG